MGIDPGAKGAIALYDADSKTLGPVWDMPTYTRTVGRTVKERLHGPNLMDLINLAKGMQVECAALEEVGGMPRQNANSAFSFGQAYGMTHMALLVAAIPVDHVRPSLWKKVMKCGTTNEEIAYRARELMPGHEGVWTTKRGAIKDGRAEAAMLAYYAARFSIMASTRDIYADKDT